MIWIKKTRTLYFLPKNLILEIGHSLKSPCMYLYKFVYRHVMPIRALHSLGLGQYVGGCPQISY
jgi:hypothetical protein